MRETILKWIKKNDYQINVLTNELRNEDLNDKEYDETLEKLDKARGMSIAFNKTLSLLDVR